MSYLADAIYAAPQFKVERSNLDRVIRDEIKEAKRLQKEVGCSWAEALRLARD